MLLWCQACAFCISPAAPVTPAADEIHIVEMQGVVQVYPKGAASWSLAQTNQTLHPEDRLQAGPNSRVALRWADESVISFGPSTELEVLPPHAPGEEAGLNLLKGIASFFHRDQPGRIHIITRGAVAGVEGTEFVMAADETGRTKLSVLNGRVRFGNDQATLLLTDGEQAEAAPGKAPTRTAGFVANNLLQWCFYYPAVLDPDELRLTAGEQTALSNSLAAYRNGDLLAALATYPPGRTNAADREKVYHAALLLSVGEVADAEAALSAVTDKAGRPAALGLALRQLIAAVKQQPAASDGQPQLATELLADSYFEQSRAIREQSLERALRRARQATEVSPQFGFAWARVAELEFSFGRTRSAFKALQKSLALSPRNAQALALMGFILTAQDQPRKAREWFDRAIAADAALGNAWLGRGIVRMHLRDKAGGREDLLVAAALELQRAELRSYLGKGYAYTGDDVRAAKELALAKKLDPNDPTAWLYSALLNQQDNEINDAIRDLEKSQDLNNNRSVYRSQLMLDEDAAVRSANLAYIYQDAGLFNQSLLEASRSVSSDYANYSAHAFLANTYGQLRDPNWANLRYEAPANDEFWIANLLAPASAGWFSPIVAEQPYAKLFDQDRLGAISDTTYLSRGAWIERGAQFGTSDKFSYNVDATYISDPGQRPDEQLMDRDINVSLKYQVTPQDSILFSWEQTKIESGDENEYYARTSSVPSLSFMERQEPNIFVGLHHEWNPGMHTLFLVSSIRSESETEGDAGQWLVTQYNGDFNAVRALPDQIQTWANPHLYTAELQQIWETPNHTTVVGARYLWGDIDYQNIEYGNQYLYEFTFSGNLGPNYPNPQLYPWAIANQNIDLDVHHESLYAYHDWQIFDQLKLFAGVSYDYLQEPAVVDSLPFSNQERSTAQTSPKVGLVFNPLENTTLRAAYSRSLSGFANDSSLQIAPTEVAGFNQVYRNVIPSSVVGDTSGSRIDAIDVSLEQKFNSGTYLALTGEMLYSRLSEYQGGYYWDTSDSSTMLYPVPQSLQELLDYKEPSVTLSADQLLGKQWTVGARYRVSQAQLDGNYVNLPATLPAYAVDPPFQVRSRLRSTLNTVNLHANWNHSSGLFSVLEADWYHQDNQGFYAPEPGDAFWQVNFTAGWRFWHRRAEISAGILNLLNQGYNLEPLNVYNEMPERRTYFVRALFSF